MSDPQRRWSVRPRLKLSRMWDVDTRREEKDKPCDSKHAQFKQTICEMTLSHVAIDSAPFVLPRSFRLWHVELTKSGFNALMDIRVIAFWLMCSCGHGTIQNKRSIRPNKFPKFWIIPCRKQADLIEEQGAREMNTPGSSRKC